MPFELPNLKYTYDALEPYIDAKTMEIHHSKHHQAYVANLNKALETHPESSNKPLEALLKSLDQISEDIRPSVRNNGGGHYNHTLFWDIMGRNKGGVPKKTLLLLINKNFGNFDSFKAEFAKAALARFGSGWVWLIFENENLSITSTPNQDSPIMESKIPILGLDVWEHAYYLKYQNRRAEYVEAWWNVVDWEIVEKNLGAAKK